MSRLSGETASLSRTCNPAAERHFVTFALDQWEYGIEVADVCGIYHGVAIIPTPDDPEIITGEVCLTTQRIPVMDLRDVLHLTPRVGTGWLLVVRHGLRMVGFLVDQVREVIRVPAAAVHPCDVATASSLPGAIDCVLHVQDRTIHVPDIPRILSECPV